MKTVAVFFGGKSNEREISVITGMYCTNLLREKYRLLPVYLDPAGKMLLCDLRGVDDFRRAQENGFKGRSFKRLSFVRGGLREPNRKPIPVDCALNCCHGGAGEGGELSALLHWYGIPSASPDMATSAVFLDKVLSKFLLKGMGIPVLDAFSLREEEFVIGSWRQRAGELGYPLIVKPAKLGSSVGIAVAHNEEELVNALALAFELDDAALIEKYLRGKRDLNIAAYLRGSDVVLSPIEEVFSASPILTFGEKYEEDKGRRELPADLDEGTAEKIKNMLACVYAQLGMKGVVRADFLLSPAGEVYFNELNTVPGTLATYLFGSSLTDARRLLEELIEEGMTPKKERTVLSSGILSNPVFSLKNGTKRHI